MSILLKKCYKCSQEKLIKEFCKNKNNKDGLNNRCKECSKKHHNQWYLKNKQKVINNIKKWRLNNPEKRKKQDEVYRLKHPNEIKKSKNLYKINHSDRVKKSKEKWHLNQLKKSSVYKLINNYRSRINWALKLQNVKKSLHTIEDLGCNTIEFKNYINSKLKPGMLLENNGLKKWHIHHIIPIHTFDLNNIEEQKKAFHYTNCIPIWEDEHKELHKIR
jgi:hypothetical protein